MNYEIKQINVRFSYWLYLFFSVISLTNIDLNEPPDIRFQSCWDQLQPKQSASQGKGYRNDTNSFKILNALNICIVTNNQTSS